MTTARCPAARHAVSRASSACTRAADGRGQLLPCGERHSSPDGSTQPASRLVRRGALTAASIDHQAGPRARGHLEVVVRVPRDAGETPDLLSRHGHRAVAGVRSVVERGIDRRAAHAGAAAATGAGASLALRRAAARTTVAPAAATTPVGTGRFRILLRLTVTARPTAAAAAASSAPGAALESRAGASLRRITAAPRPRPFHAGQSPWGPCRHPRLRNLPPHRRTPRRPYGGALVKG